MVQHDIVPERRTSLLATNAARPRSPSVTHIPRPISGTSRRASSTLLSPFTIQGSNISRLSRLFSPDQPSRQYQSQHSSCRTNNGMPPTSFPLSDATLPRSNSFTLHKNRLEKHRTTAEAPSEHPPPYESGNYVPVIVGSCESARNTAQQFSLPSAQLSPRKSEVTPHMLMRPIQPSLPRSHTTGQLACFNVTQDDSPAKPNRTNSLAHTFQNEIEYKVKSPNLTSRESGMRDSINTVMSQDIAYSGGCDQTVPRKKLASQRNKLASAPTVQVLDTISKSPIVVNLSVNDNANARRVEEQRRRMSWRRPLFINTTLANTSRNDDSSPLTNSTPHSTTTDGTLSSPECSQNIKHVRKKRYRKFYLTAKQVYKAENIAYWTGRYMSATDRTRKEDCDILLHPKDKTSSHLNINSTEFEEQFDKLEASRKLRVLEELRQYCKTQHALKGFGQFENQLRGRMSKPVQPRFIRSYSEFFTKQNSQGQSKSLPVTQATSIEYRSGNQAVQQLSTSDAQATIAKLSGRVPKKGNLVKSKTTGNLELKSVARRAPTPAYVPQGHSGTTSMRLPQIPKASAPVKISESRAKAVAEREGRYYGRKVSQQGPVKEAKLDNASSPDLAAVKGFRSTVHHGECWPLGSGAMATLSASNTGENAVPEVVRPPIDGCGDGSLNNNTIRETVLFHKTRQTRQNSGQSSGEFVKKAVDAGMREVRKMSRRVGSMGWGGSSDDLPGRNRVEVE